MISVSSKFGRWAIVPILLSSLTACPSSEPPQTNASAPTPSPAVQVAPVPKPSASTPAPVLQAELVARADDKAASAATLARSAASSEDWELVASKYQAAIGLLKSVPPSSPTRAQAQKKMSIYQKQLSNAKRRSKTPVEVESSPETPVASNAVSEGVGAGVEPIANDSNMSQSNYDRLKLGMSVSEVLAILGTPSGSIESNGDATYTWNSSNNRMQIGATFRDGKLASMYRVGTR